MSEQLLIFGVIKKMRWLSCFLCLFAVACGEKPSPGQGISGSVTVEGKPLRIGTLTLKPLTREGGPKISARIRDGKFHILPTNGPWPGEFQVSIAIIPPDLEAFLAGASHEEVAKRSQESYRVISKEFDSQSKLTMIIKAGEANHADFDVKWASP